MKPSIKVYDLTHVRRKLKWGLRGLYMCIEDIQQDDKKIDGEMVAIFDKKH